MQDDYSEDSITIISGRQAVRARPGMYFGAMDGRAVIFMLCELIANVADHFLAGHASRVEISRDGAWWIVRDDGPGMPFEGAGDPCESHAMRFLTELHHSATADGHAPHIHISNIHGVGMAAALMACDRWRVESYRRGDRYRVASVDGVAHVEVERSTSGIGTTFAISPDEELFDTTHVEDEVLEETLSRCAWLFPGFELYLEGRKFCSTSGILDAARGILSNHTHSARTPPHDVTFAHRGRYMEVDFDVVAIWCDALADAHIERSWVNGIETREGGSHIDQMSEHLARAGVRCNLLLVHAILRAPEFGAPVRDRLIHPRLGANLGGWIARVMENKHEATLRARPGEEA